MLCGIYLIIIAGWVILAIGAASILAGVLYTGGPRPYGYEGLGDVFVFLFFGLVAVTGSYYAQVERLEWEAFALAVPVGLLAAAILDVNNIRDAPTDARVGKRTIAVRLGRKRARDIYAAEVYLAFLVPLIVFLASDNVGPWVLLTWLALPLAVPLVRTRASARRRADAQRRAGQDRPAAARVLRAVERRAAAQLSPAAEVGRAGRRWAAAGVYGRGAAKANARPGGAGAARQLDAPGGQIEGRPARSLSHWHASGHDNPTSTRARGRPPAQPPDAGRRTPATPPA